MATNNAYSDDGDTVGMTSFSTAPAQTTPSLKEEKFENIKVEEDELKRSRASSLSSRSTEHDGPYAGMPKEVLLQYSRQRKFVWARNIMMGLVILTILVLISLVIAIIVISPPCLDYWQTSPIYQVYPKSFKDSWAPNQEEGGPTDGIGDLYGIIDQLQYFEDLGVRVLWLNPVYTSPQKDNGYDISDFRGIDELFGGMEAFELLVEEMHSRGMKLVMDFVPNHSSNEHEWFNASSNPAHEDYDKYKDYYMWLDPPINSSVSPNNWVSEFDNVSAWTYLNEREQFYYHGFYAEQPDLNLRNEIVKEELKDILRFWMDKGVDGFRCDALAYMLEAEHLRNNPMTDPNEKPWKGNVYPDYTQNYKGVHDIVADWRIVLDDYSTEPGVYRFMQTEMYSDNIEDTMRYYGTKRAPEADFPMNFLLITADPATEWNANSMQAKVLNWMRNMPQGKWPSWTVSNHDNPRLPSRVGTGLARCAAVMIMTLPGTPGFYYGDEIGMLDNDNIPPEQSEDFRDPERTPMQWDNSENAGFCENCDPWLPVNQDYTSNNVEAQTGDENSMLEMYKTLISLRQDMVYQRGYFCMLDVQATNTLAYVRELPGISSRMILINFDRDGEDSTINLKQSYGEFLNKGRVSFVSETNGMSHHEVGESIDFGDITLPPGRGMIVDFNGPGRQFHDGDGIECFIHKKVCYDKALGIVKTC